MVETNLSSSHSTHAAVAWAGAGAGAGAVAWVAAGAGAETGVGAAAGAVATAGAVAGAGASPASSPVFDAPTFLPRPRPPRAPRPPRPPRSILRPRWPVAPEGSLSVPPPSCSPFPGLRLPPPLERTQKVWHTNQGSTLEELGARYQLCSANGLPKTLFTPFSLLCGKASRHSNATERACLTQERQPVQQGKTQQSLRYTQVALQKLSPKAHEWNAKTPMMTKVVPRLCVPSPTPTTWCKSLQRLNLFIRERRLVPAVIWRLCCEDYRDDGQQARGIFRVRILLLSWSGVGNLHRPNFCELMEPLDATFQDLSYGHQNSPSALRSS